MKNSLALFFLSVLFLCATLINVGGCSKVSDSRSASAGSSTSGGTSAFYDTSNAWTMFHGLDGTNKSPETGLLKSWGENGPTLLWKADFIGNTEFPGYASVTVANGKVFTAGNVMDNGNNDVAGSFVFALNEMTGEEIWRYRNGTAWTDKGHFPGERGTPSIDGDRIYAMSSVGRLACIEADTGNEIWVRNLKEEYEINLPVWAFAESPFIDGDKVMAWTGGEKAAVVAMNKMTGETIWTTPATGVRGNYATMLPFDFAGQRVYVNANQTGFLAVNAETGKVLFELPHKTEWDVMATIPYFYDDKLFVMSGYGTGSKLYKLEANGEEITPALIWENSQFDNMHGGTVVKDGYVYFANHYHGRQRMWSCVKIEDGTLAWENPGVWMGSLTYADGMLYCLAEREGTVALVNATPEKYDEVSRFTLPAEDEGGGKGMFWAHPVVINGKLFLRHAQFLYCYDVKAQ